MNIYCFSTLSFAKLQFKSVINKAFHKHGVASFTDAWIETDLPVYSETRGTVASFTDAWIETGLIRITGCKHLSRIFYRCVDWNIMYRSFADVPEVASFTDAWIETSCRWWKWKSDQVASFTDAWIETDKILGQIHFDCVASFTDAWIETGCCVC